MLGTEDMVMNKTNMVPPLKDAYSAWIKDTQI